MSTDLQVRTVTARAMLREAVDSGILLDAGRGVYALTGTPAAARGASGPPRPRTPPHDPVHEGSGSALYW